jgi:agmatine deiminase
MEHLRAPPEWDRHTACWLAWPDHADWGPGLEPARAGFLELCAALGESERLEVLVPDLAAEERIRAYLPAGANVNAHRLRYGDVWLRDSGPVFVRDADRLAAACFRWSGWGGKYLYVGDEDLAGRIADAAGARRIESELVFEGGALDTDGEGTALTTRECLLNPNRNPQLGEAEIEAALASALGVERLLWLDRGLANDHTDGHIDNIARFVAAARVVCMEPAGRADPNREVLRAIAAELSSFRDAADRPLEVVRVPSPGRVEDERGALLPASYLNFYVANDSVVVPVYGTPQDQEAVDILAELFPGRRAVGLDARAILAGGGGAFHCMTREQPEP